MAITNGYATLVEFKAWLNIDDATDDTELELAVESASRAIDDYCNRHFYSAAQTRYYTANASGFVRVDDLVSITTLKTDASGDGVYETTWSAADYRLEPFNANTDGRPYRQVCRSQTAGKSFPRVPRGVEVVGSFGWPAVPSAVKMATLFQAARLWRRGRDAPLGIMHMPGVEGGGGMRLHAKVDVDVQVLLADYRRDAVKVG